MAIKVGGTTVIDDSLNGINFTNLNGYDGNTIKYKQGEMIWYAPNPNWDQKTDINNYFGYRSKSISANENYLVIGSYFEDGNQTGNDEGAGVVYIYDIHTGKLIKTLLNPETSPNLDLAGDNFGSSVAIDGSKLIVGAYNEENGRGACYVFDVPSWELLHVFVNQSEDGDTNDLFGVASDLKGNIAVIGATGEDVPYLDSGKVYIADINARIFLNTLLNPNEDQSTAISDQFGYAIAISGNYALVSAYQEDFGVSNRGIIYIIDIPTATVVHSISPSQIGSGFSAGPSFGTDVDAYGNYGIGGALGDDTFTTDAGSAFIFDIEQGTVLHELTNPNANSVSDTDEYFGIAVAIGEKYAAVGAIGENSNTGAVYIFEVLTGNHVHTILPTDVDLADGASLGDKFGCALEIQGNLLVVGTETSDNPYSGSGHISVFALEDIVESSAYKNTINPKIGNLVNNLNDVAISSGRIFRSVINPNIQTSSPADDFASTGVEGVRSVAISGNRAIIGAYSEDLGATNAGVAYIVDVPTGKILHTLSIADHSPTTPTNYYFGWSVAIDGQWAVVGAPYENAGGRTGAGCIYVFNVNTGALKYRIEHPNQFNKTNDFSQFGYAVSISGDRFSASAPNAGTTQLNDGGGVVYHFEISTGTQYSYSSNTSTVAFEGYGNSIAEYGGIVAIGNPGHNSYAGRVYIVQRTTNAIISTIENPSGADGSNFGVSVSIDANHLAVGAKEYDSPYTGSGRAYIFRNSSFALEHTLESPNYDQSTNTFDRFGTSVSLSEGILAVGAPNEEVDLAVNSGVVYIYDIASGSLTNTIIPPKQEGSIYFGRNIYLNEGVVVIGGDSTVTGGVAYFAAAKPMTKDEYLYNLVY